MGLFKPNVKRLEKKRDVDGLAKALKHKDVYVRRSAVYALARIGDSRAIEPLIQALKDSDSGVREEAVHALDPGGGGYPFYAGVLSRIKDERPVEPLIETLKNDNNDDVRKEAAGVLGRIGDKRSVEPLIQTLKDKRNSMVGWAAAIALGKIGDARAIEPLAQAIENSDEYVRKASIEALGETGDVNAIKPLVKAVKIFEGPAVEAIQKIVKKRADDQSLKDELAQALKNEKDSKAREIVALILGRLGDLRAAEEIINLLCLEKAYQKGRPPAPALEMVMVTLFGDYTNIIWGALYVQKEYSVGSYNLWGGGVEGVKQLCEINTQVSTNILHKISRRRDFSEEFGTQYETVVYKRKSFGAQRYMARKELKRRGNPPYDSSVYLKREAWQL